MLVLPNTCIFYTFACRGLGNVPQANFYFGKLTVLGFMSISWPRNVPQGSFYFEKLTFLGFMIMSWPRNVPQASFYVEKHSCVDYNSF